MPTPENPPEGTGDALLAIARVLAEAEPRPDSRSPSEEKTKYATRFAEEMGLVIADSLSPRLAGITATTKRSAGSVKGKKQLDVNFSTPEHGLALGISLKSVHTRDVGGGGRYTHNMKRNEEELRIESSGYHKRQPYAVMVAVLFLPFDSCSDGKKNNPSSFGSWVRHLRPLTGRRKPTNDNDLFEKIYIGLYEPDGTDLRFFDVESDPPKNGQPQREGYLHARDGRARRLLTFGEFLEAVYHLYLQRNAADFRWAEAGEDPLTISEIDGGGEDESS
jgi:hypothetical protein